MSVNVHQVRGNMQRGGETTNVAWRGRSDSLAILSQGRPEVVHKRDGGLAGAEIAIASIQMEIHKAKALSVLKRSVSRFWHILTCDEFRSQGCAASPPLICGRDASAAA
jgi:hypothetical protein